MNDELARIGAELQATRENVSALLTEAANAARAARAAGMSEVVIARTLGVSRHTVRAWLGKSRQR
jgi:DNA-binding transcriptional regulator YiaG